MPLADKPDGLTDFGLTLEEAILLPPGKRRTIAGYLARFGYYDQALGLLNVMASEQPNGMLYRMWLVWAMLGCGKIDEADALSRELIIEFADKLSVILTRIDVLFAKGEFEAAHELLQKTFEDEPRENYNYWARLGLACQRRGSWNRARNALERSLTIYRALDEEPEHNSAPLFFWMALAQQEEHDGSESREFRDHVEDLRKQEEQHVLAELEKPNPRSTKHSSTPKFTANEESDRSSDSDIISADQSVQRNPQLESQLKKLFGFEEFRQGQQQVIEHVLAGRSVLAIMPTGAGKSLCYQLPAMLLDGLTLVVSPLIALMKDQIDGLPADIQHQVTLINSTLEGDEIDRRLKEIRRGKYRLVYAAPERLRQGPFLHALRSRGVSLLVVDEAHCVSMWGHDFRPDYLFIGSALRYLGEPAVLAMTATATPKMRRDISDQLGRQLNVISTGTHRPNLFLESKSLHSDEEKMREVIKLCKEIDGAGIIYTRSRKKAEELARILSRERVRATYYHAGMESDERTRTQEEFMDGRWRVICATVAFGMGIDKPDVRFVIHYSLPEALEDYYQEAGRAGRDGLPSRCILLFTSSDKASITRWMRQERIDAKVPRESYKIIRELTLDSPFMAVHPDDFERELRQDETRIRVAISMLEDIEMVRRHPDVPMTMTIGLTHKGSDQNGELAEFIRNARLRPRQRLSVETMNLSSRTGIPPHNLEERLLNWQDEGYLTYWGSGRVMLLERLPAPRDSRYRLDDLISRYAKVQEARVEEVFRYAETHRCKHDTIAAHFGEPAITNCSACDNCSSIYASDEPLSKHAAPAKESLTDEQKRLKVIETVNMIPGKVGFTGLMRVLKGSITSYIKSDTCPNFGIFANLPRTTVERCVSELLEDGLIHRDDSEYRLIWPHSPHYL